MSYNIFSKNASFKGDISGTIENQVNDWDTQTVNGAKTFTNLTASNGIVFSDGLISGSGTISASFFFGDGAGLTNAGTITAFNNSGENRILAGDSTSTTIKGLSDVTFSGGKLGVTGQLSASLGVSGTTFHGAGGAITDLDADNITAGSLSAARLDLASAGGLENNSDSLQINLSGSTSGLSLDSDGLQIDIDTLGTDSGFDTGKKVIVQDGANPPKQMTLSVIQSGLTIQGSQLGGTIVNGRLPTAISQPFITGSTAVSGAFFFGDGSGLTNVTSTPSPAGSNTQIQFNDDNALAADAELTFLTGSNTLATSNLSASVNISGSSLFVQDEIIVGGQTFVNSEGNIAAVGEVTASGDISSSLDMHALNFRGNGSTLNNVPLGSSNAASIVFIDNETNKTITTNAGFTFNGTHAVNTGGGFKGTILSASGDLQVGGHITGSGDLKLLDGNIHLNSTVFFDSSESTGDCLIRQNPDNSLTVDANNNLWLVADENIYITKNFTQKVNFDVDEDVAIYHIAISSSQLVSASVLHTMNGITAPGPGGDINVLDSNGNLNVGSITMADGAGPLNFGNNEISGSGNISGSAFFGDGSGLTNVPAPSFHYHNFSHSLTTGLGFVLWGVDTNALAMSNNLDQTTNGRWWPAPHDGTLNKIIVSLTNKTFPGTGAETLQVSLYTNENSSAGGVQPPGS